MRVGFTMAPCRRLRFNLSDLYPVPRLGAAQLAAVMRAKGHAVSFVDVMAQKWSDTRFGEWVAAERLDLIAVSATIVSLREAFALCAAAKAARPEVRTIIGGPGVGGWEPALLMARAGRGVDFAVRGEGEVPLPALARALSEGVETLREVPGLVWREGSTVHENAAPAHVSLDRFPGPAWDLMPMGQYRLHPPLGIHPPATLLETARGCTFPCGFCCLAGPLRQRSVAWVIAQIEGLQQRYGIREVHFVDPTFTLDRARTLALCEAVGQLERPLHWTCKTRVDRVDPALLRSMADAGCYAIAFGVESGHDGMLADVKKSLSTGATVAAFEACRVVGIRTIAYCLVGAPGETDQTVGATIAFVRKIRADYVLYGIIDADPVNALTRQAVSRGWLSREDVADHYMSDKSTWLDHHTITGHPLPRAQAWLRRATTDFYLRPQYAFQRVRDLRSLQDMKNLAAGGLGLARDMLRAPRSLLTRGESPPG